MCFFYLTSVQADQITLAWDASIGQTWAAIKSHGQATKGQLSCLFVLRGNKAKEEKDNNLGGHRVFILPTGNELSGRRLPVSTLFIAGMLGTQPLPAEAELVARPDEASTATGKQISIDVLANDDWERPGIMKIVDVPDHGSAYTSDNILYYTSHQGYLGLDQLIYQIANESGASAVASVNLNVGCDGCASGIKVTVAWNQNPSKVIGYLVYYDRSSAGEDWQLMSDLGVAEGDVNPLAPSVTYDAGVDLNAVPGDTVCFRIMAYNDGGESDFSSSKCISI